MTNPQEAPYGSWKSPITADLVVSKSIRLGNIMLDGQDIYWLESRPLEGGRSVIVKRMPDGTIQDINPAPFNARTRVHEYGGGSFTVHAGTVYFSDFQDQRLYSVKPGEPPKPLTEASAFRYADGVIDPARGRMVCVREDHTAEGEAVNTLASINLDNGAQHVLMSGNDFYSTPRLNADGTRLAWLTWNHPNMPWDGTELWVADVQTDGMLTNARHIAGSVEESIFQPEWSPDGMLYFVSDRTGWWNLYRWPGPECSVETLTNLEAEFGLPQWVFRMNTYTFASAKRVLCTYIQNGVQTLASLDPCTRDLTPLDLPYTSIESPQATRTHAIFQASAAKTPSAIVKLNLETEEYEVLKRSSELQIKPGYISTAQPVTFPTENGLVAHGFFYPPQNQDFTAPADEKPPLLVLSHGGPTGRTTDKLDPKIQYWTSRGFGVLDVNYGGSAGYGRAYRERLKGQWGVVDVDDCTNGARYLAKQGSVDGERLAIRGGSAGGYTTLCALTFCDVFKSGASYYGVSDLEALAQETHKFESRYLDGLVGPYPERRDLYVARSPIHHVEELNCPVIFFQGLEDKVVLPNQAEKMVAALRDKGIPVAYLPFEGEQHGFRRAENIKRAWESERYFYARIFGFDLAEPVDPLTIENLED